MEILGAIGRVFLRATFSAYVASMDLRALLKMSSERMSSY
jgi:hypothetical protein